MYKYRIKKCVNKVYLFPECTPQKNRKLTSKEYAEECEDAKIWERFPRDYLLDKPFYPWVKPDYSKCVNFDLNIPEFGI